MGNRRSGLGWLPVVCALAVLGMGGGDDTRLADAARVGDIAAVDDLLQSGAVVDAPDLHDTTALHWAVYRDDVEMVTRLIVAGADVNRTNRYDETPLSLACVNGNPGIVEDLLELGALPNLRAAGEPPLLTCARSGNLETVELLHAHGANPNIADDWKGQTAVMWAAAEDHVAVIETLVAHGADVNASAMPVPVREGLFGNSIATAKPGQTALFIAVQLGHEASTRALLATGADVSVTSPAGAPLAHVAAAAGHHRLGAELLDHGLDPNALDKQGQSALHAVVEARRLKHQSRRTTPDPESFAFMEHLIAAGADIDALMVVTPPQNSFDKPDKADDNDDQDDAAADEANATQEEEKAKEEQKKERTPDQIAQGLDFGPDLVEATPFLLAARSADLDAMRLLLEHGADPLTTTKGGNTALTLASGVVFLEGGFGQFEGPPKSDVLEAVQLLLELGADVNTGNSGGSTALHGAVYRAADDVIRFLVEAGARTDAEDAAGRTPLRLAEQGFNQFASQIRRERSAELLRQLDGRARPRPQANAEVKR